MCACVTEIDEDALDDECQMLNSINMAGYILEYEDSCKRNTYLLGII